MYDGVKMHASPLESISKEFTVSAVDYLTPDACRVN